MPPALLEPAATAGAGPSGAGGTSATVTCMRFWSKLLIVWFITLALPLQGVAGVTMAHCGSSHERMGAPAQASPHGHADHGGAAHHHDADGNEAAALSGHDAADPAQAEPDPWSDLAQYKCSSCAACCAGTALPPAVPGLPQVTAAPVVFAEDVLTVDAFASGGPDRPPRTPLV